MPVVGRLCQTPSINAPSHRDGLQLVAEHNKSEARSCLFQMITGQFRIDFGTPGIDPAAETPHICKAVTLKIGCRIEAARSLMVVNNEQIISGPLGQNLLHQILGKQLGPVDFYGVVFLACADIEKLNFFPVRNSTSEFGGLNLHSPIGSIAGDDMLANFVEIQGL